MNSQIELSHSEMPSLLSTCYSISLILSQNLLTAFPKRANKLRLRPQLSPIRGFADLDVLQNSQLQTSHAMELAVVATSGTSNHPWAPK